MCCGTKYPFLRKLRNSGVHGTDTRILRRSGCPMVRWKGPDLSLRSVHRVCRGTNKILVQWPRSWAKRPFLACSKKRHCRGGILTINKANSSLIFLHVPQGSRYPRPQPPGPMTTDLPNGYIGYRAKNYFFSEIGEKLPTTMR